jgi:hypothetical protein
MSYKTDQQDDFWTHRQQLFTGTFSYFRNQPKAVYGRFHVSEERYSDKHDEIVPLWQASGKRTYVMFHPYALVPNITLTIGLYRKPKQYADMEPSIGKVQSSEWEGEREEQLGSGQAWYYHTDRILVLWECFLSEFFRGEGLGADENMRSLWTGRRGIRHFCASWATARSRDILPMEKESLRSHRARLKYVLVRRGGDPLPDHPQQTALPSPRRHSVSR